MKRKSNNSECKIFRPIDGVSVILFDNFIFVFVKMKRQKEKKKIKQNRNGKLKKNIKHWKENGERNVTIKKKHSRNP